MPTAKKAKLEKVIKSIDKKKDVLTLECEWATCDYVCNDTDSFLVHISQHMDEMMMCETVVKSSEDAGKADVQFIVFFLLCITNIVFCCHVAFECALVCSALCQQGNLAYKKSILTVSNSNPAIDMVNW